MTRVLVVDDSPLMRRYIGRIIDGAGGFTVDTCADGETALARIREAAPDVVTLDVQMPGLDGLATLARIMVEHPCPVVMVSAFTDRGARTTLEALALGAIDYIAKPEGTISLHVDDWGPLLVTKLRLAAGAKVHAAPVRPAALPAAGAARPDRPTGVPAGVVLIGASTGGPQALEWVLPALPADFAWPVIVAQHMPAKFTRLFAERMSRICPLGALEVSAPVPLTAGIHVAQGDRDMRLSRRGEQVFALPVPRDPIYAWHPSVDGLVESAVECFAPASVIGVLLTGMGRDGAAALTRLKRLGGRTIAEAEESAVVFGMPGQLVAMEGATCVLPAQRIAAQLVDWLALEERPCP